MEELCGLYQSEYCHGSNIQRYLGAVAKGGEIRIVWEHFVGKFLEKCLLERLITLSCIQGNRWEED
jgi:hypothetical protein